MSLNFNAPIMHLNGANAAPPPLELFNSGFHINGSDLTKISYSDIVLSGVGSLSLTNAKANGLNYLKLYGGCEQRNLPSGYTEYEYLRSSGTQYIDLGYKGKGNTKVEIKFRYYQTSSATGSDRVFGSRQTSSSNAFAIGTSSGIVSSTGNKVFWCYDGQSFYVVEDVPFGLDEWQTVVFSATEHTVNGTTEGDDYTVTTFETPANLKLFAFDNNGTIGCGYVDIAYCKLWDDDGTLVRNVVPSGDGTTYSMYDKVSGTMLPNAGTGDFAVGNVIVPTPTTPVDIVTNNGVLKLSPNLANMVSDNITVGYYISASGTVLQSDYNFIYNKFIPVKPNTTYTLSFSNALYFVSISEYSANDGTGFIQRTSFTSSSLEAPFNLTNCTITTGATTNYIRWGSNMYKNQVLTLDDILAINWMLNIGDTMAYQPYVKGGIYTNGTTETVQDSLNNTATAQNLFAVGTVKDVQEVLTGAVTRNIGIKVLDGTESWTASGNLFYTGIATDALEDTHSCYCTHFKGVATNASASYQNEIKVGTNATQTVNWTRVQIYPVVGTYSDVTTLKSWLATQYQNGQPVIIIYPLKTATTETVTGQSLTTKKGSNTIQITQSAISGLSVEASYKGTQS